MSADKVSPDEEQLAKDAREFGSLVVQVVQNEIEGEARELRLQDIRSVFLQAIDHIEKRYGSESAAMWQDEANRVIQQRFAALNPSLAQSHEEHLQDHPDAQLPGKAGLEHEQE